MISIANNTNFDAQNHSTVIISGGRYEMTEIIYSIPNATNYMPAHRNTTD